MDGRSAGRPAGIPRVPMVDRSAFYERYVFTRQPVVITNLFDGQEVSSIRTVDDARRVWGTVKLRLQEEYASAEGRPHPPQPVSMSLGEYLDLTSKDPSTRLCCTEYETPARVLASFRLPDACLDQGPAAEEVFGLPRKYGDHDLATNTFVANAGNVAHLHFDGDQRQVLLHQVYGRKRVVLFPPDAAVHLRTLDGPFSRPSLAGVFIDRISREQCDQMIELAGGFETILEPGETLYIPMLMWHYIEYLDDAMSFNIRFGRTSVGRFLSLDHFHRDPYIQNVSALMTGTAEQMRGYGPAVEEIKAVYLKPVEGLHDKVRLVRALFRDLGSHLCPEASLGQICPPEREEEQIDRIVQGRDMAGGLKYAAPEIIARTRPAGAITERQLGVLRDRVRDLGYSRNVEESVLVNRTGKHALEELTKAEGAQLIEYLTNPGAAW